MAKPIKLAVVVSHPIQHFIHFYRALHQCEDINLLVIFASDLGARKYFDKDMKQEIKWNIDLFGGYHYKVLPESRKIEKTGFKEINNPSVVKELENFAPDVVKVHGYSQLTVLRTLIWCKVNSVPTLLWSDSNISVKKSIFKAILKKITLSLYFKLISGVLTVGDKNEEYYKHYGVPAEKNFRTPFTIDEQLYLSVRRNRQELKDEFRVENNLLEDDFLVLFVGKLIQRKRPNDLIEAINIVNRTKKFTKRVVAVFAGNGELADELAENCKRKNVHAIFLGFVNVDVLPNVYAASDILSHPAEVEPYGLVLREATAVGLPLVISDRVGAVGNNDAARDQYNAHIHECGNIVQLANGITQLLDCNQYEKYSHNSLIVFNEMNIDKSVSGIRRAIQFVKKG